MKTIKFLSALVIGMMIVSSIPLFATAQEANDTLIIALQADMVDMNPWNPDTNAVWKSNQIGWNHETLMSYNPDFDLYPVLAAADAAGPNGADVTIDSTDGLNMTLKLKEDVTFTDGTPMTSRDVVFSYQTLAWGLFQTQVLGPLYWDTATFEDWDGNADQSRIGVWATDDYTVKFQLTEPYAMFWYSTLALPICPAHIWDDDDHLEALAEADYPGYEVETPQLYGWDYSYGSDASEIDATIGTGPMYLESWIPEQGSVIKAYEDYWDIEGTTTWGSEEYPNYPLHVTTIKFKIYTQLDVAILALQNGEVHHLPWSLTPGYYNLLKTDPNIGIETPKDQGLFYLTFNMRKGAMADVEFRKAVSYAVDKDYIVNRLLGGYGIKGSVPMSVTNNLYVNSTVPAWIEGGDLTAAEDTLDAAGYVDADGDGWRDMPDGSPLKYNILTPPKDYDPIRADSGIMIEKNLKAIGLNVAAVPTSFDTIVSAAFVSVDFDMYILGWSVGSFPENYLRDFFHSSADTAVNPAGSNAGGYDNPEYDALVDDLEKEMDTELRVQMVKDACGLTMEDVAYNTLFYKTNIEAFRADIWSGWVPAFGSIYNGFSIFNLAPPESSGGSEGSSGGSATITGIDGGINAPSMVGAGQTVSGSLIATETLESLETVPSEGATVDITTSLGDEISGTTDSDGMVFFDFDVPYQKLSTIRIDANISKSGAWTNINKTINVQFTNYLAQLSLSTDDGVIAPDATTEVTATVTDENGDPIEGVDVFVDTALMFGTVDEATKTTDADGIAVFDYTAPSVDMLPNTHRFEQFKANITVANTIVPEVQSSSLIIGISSDTYDWHDLDITDVSDFVIDNIGASSFQNTTTITLELTDEDEAVVADHYVSIELSEDGTVIDANATMLKTDADGIVSFNLTVDETYTGAGAVIATFNTSKSYSIKDSVAIYIRNDPTYTQEMYYLNVTAVSEDEIYNQDWSAVNTTTVDVVLYNSTWEPVGDMDVYMGLSDTSFVNVSAEFNTTDAWGNATFNITCVANTTGTTGVDLALGFGIEGGIGIFEGYNLKVNKTAAIIVATQEVIDELVFGPATGGEMGPWTLTNTPIFDATVYRDNGGTWTMLTETTEYTLDDPTGEINMVDQLMSGDSLYAYYNYTAPAVINETVFTSGAGGETILDPFANIPVIDATVYKDEAGVWTKLVDPADYSIVLATGVVTLTAGLTIGDIIHAYYNYSVAVANETVFAGPAVGGEAGPLGTLANTPIVNYKIYNENGAVFTELTDTTDYTLVPATGAYTQFTPLEAGDNIYAFYNYTYDLTHHALTAVADTHIIDNNMFSNATPGTSYIVVTLADTDGNPQAGVDIHAYTMIGDEIVTLDKLFNTTDAFGNVQFNVTSMSNMASNVVVYFEVNNTAGVTESVMLYNAEYLPGYAANISFDGIAEHDSTMDITATVYDESGAPAVGVPCQFFIPPTSEGIPGVFDGGDSWYWEQYDDYFDMGWWAGYLGSWYGNNTMLGATLSDANGEFEATIDTASFVADVEIPLQFAVGGTGVTDGFNYSANQWWMEYYPDYAAPLSDNDAVYYWVPGTVTITDQVILKRAPLAVLTNVEMDQPFLSAGDNTSTVSLTFQDLAGDLDTATVNFGEGTASPDILDEDSTSAAGVYAYDYTTDGGDFDSGIGFTTVVTESDYAKFPFNFYLPYLADGTDAMALVVDVVATDYVLTIGENVTLDVVVTDQYGNLMSGVVVESGDESDTTAADGVAQLTIPTAAITDAGIYTIDLEATRGTTLASDEEFSVILNSAEEPAPEMVDVVIGPVLDEDGNPIEDAEVIISYDGVNYTGTTNATGYVTIEVPDTLIGEDVDVTISKDGYETITYTSELNADGTLASDPPAVVAEDDDGGISMVMIGLIIAVILVVVVLLVMMSKKGGAKAPVSDAPAEEPPMEEPPMEEPAPEPVEEVTPEPVEEVTPEPVEEVAPVEEVVPEPVEEVPVVEEKVPPTE